ncbi:glutamyl-tRNA synthetase [Thermosinus carboxydivorans Nor1]|uniref:Glutamyl-tRNA synthetase n=1 Tax=Thermosinus carboxydivorans Nor1 TaxID=401526 RepID=A1HTI1_9FIRM|nr:glutamyl-tRNA synthetase [Thermosinus carboxydivorans Nor1]
MTPEKRAWLVQVVAAVQDYISYAAQVVDHVDIFFKDEVEFESDEARQVLTDPDIPQVMAAFKSKLAALQVVVAPAVQAVLKGITKELKVGGKKVYMPIRVALTGRTHGLDLDKFIAIIGKERTLVRLQQTLAKIGL